MNPTRLPHCRLLALCAALATALPLRRADEPLLLLHAANRLVARRGAEVLASLKASLAAGDPSDTAQVCAPPCFQLECLAGIIG